MRQAYIAGPYTHADETGVLDNISIALAAALLVARRGWHPIVPHTMGTHKATWEEAMVCCRALVRGLDPLLDAVIALEGWEQSRGAREEVSLALSLGIRVMYPRNDA